MTKIIIGIQGGKGSFNEETLLLHFPKTSNYVIKYLYTTKNVLEELESGRITLGQFAISNSIGGIVDESIYASSQYRYIIKEKYTLNINQCLLVRKEANMEEIEKIVSHPQCFDQCKNNLQRFYPNLKLIIGKGKNIDPAYLATKLPKNTATIGNKRLASIYGLKVARENLQDRPDNNTTFLLVSKDIK